MKSKAIYISVLFAKRMIKNFLKLYIIFTKMECNITIIITEFLILDY